MKKTISLIGISVIAVAAATTLAMSQDKSVLPTGDADIVVGEELYLKNCAACHGTNLEGQPNWRSQGEDGRLPAPPHDEKGHTWHHTDRVIFDYTKLGGKETLANQGLDFDSGMPGFGDDLTDSEIWNILGYIKSTWPERARNSQAGRTDADNRQGEN